MNYHANTNSTSDSARATGVRILKKMSPFILLALTAIASNIASAQDARPLGVEWKCVQQNDELFHVLCIPKPTGNVAPEELGAIVKASLPERGDMQPVAKRGLAQMLTAEPLSVPLYSRPSDKVMVGYLLQTVLCDAVPNCSVNYRSN